MSAPELPLVSAEGVRRNQAVFQARAQAVVDAHLAPVPEKPLFSADEALRLQADRDRTEEERYAADVAYWVTQWPDCVRIKVMAHIQSGGRYRMVEFTPSEIGPPRATGMGPTQDVLRQFERAINKDQIATGFRATVIYPGNVRVCWGKAQEEEDESEESSEEEK